MHSLLFSAFLSVAAFGKLTELLWDIGSLIFVLGILVFVHEFGHYAVAKMCGVRVEVFSLGFGKRLFGFHRGDTDYRVSILPLGGYVKMAGENPMEDRSGDAGEFMSHPRWQRFLIAIAGPVMNIILALVVLTCLYTVHYERPGPADIGWVLPGSAAAEAGVQPGDRVIKIQNIENPNWEETAERVMINPGQSIDLTVRRGDTVFQTKIKPREAGPEKIGEAGWEPPEAALIGKVTDGRPAAKAGILPGDTIVALNQTPVRSIQEFVKMLQETKTTPVEIAVLRDGKELKFKATPEYDDGAKRYVIGINPTLRKVVEKLPLRVAAATAFAECKRNSGLIFELVPKMFEGKNSIKQMSGPIGIMRISGMAARLGWPDLLKIMSLISLNLAVFNLLPIPILDGGLMLMLLIEALMRRDINQQVKERVYQAAFVFLILFAAVVIFNDLTKQFHG